LKKFFSKEIQADDLAQVNSKINIHNMVFKNKHFYLN